ncbi:hypothetical protein ACQJBY_045370 [Aegilops geniculata]
MDTKPRVATDPGDITKLKDLLNQEDAMAMVAVTATSKKPSEEDQPPAGNINPLLISSARRGFLGALNVLLEMEDANIPPIMIATQEFLELARRGGSAKGRVAVSAARDVEKGVDHQPAGSLAAGALLKGVTIEGDTALHAVAGHGDGQNFLQYAGIIYDRDSGLLFAKNHKGDTPLHCAARAGNFKMVSHLIDLAARAGADVKLRLLRVENKHQETVLHVAVRFEDGRFLGQKERELLVGGADLDEEGKNLVKLLMGVPGDADGAPEEQNLVKLLMGADPELAKYPAGGVSPLYVAILLGKSTIALTLYGMSGGNLSYSGADGQNALHVSVLRDPVMIELLLHWNNGLSAQVDKCGSTPLHFASALYVWTGSYLHLELLLKPPWCRFVRIPRRSTSTLNILFKTYDMALYQANKDGSFPIHVAASIGAKYTIQFFHAECPNSAGLRDAEGRTLLHVAVKKEQVGIVLYVCQTPSLTWILNMQDDDGNTALHLAIQCRNIRMFCALFGNRKVNLNITNNHGETPRDISRSKIPCGVNYSQNSEHIICSVLRSLGAKSGALRWDKAHEKYSRRPKPEEKDILSERLKDTSQTFIVASVLIATVAFTASFAVPGGYRADDHTYGGTPIHAGSYVFDAFMMATTLAFICSSIATIGFAFAAVHMVSLFSRIVNLSSSSVFMASSVTSLSIAFALGVYIVLAPVAPSTAVAVCLITPAVLLSASMEVIVKMVIIARPLCIRKGLYSGTVQLLRMYVPIVFIALWPFIVTFGWAALARIHRHR